MARFFALTFLLVLLLGSVGCSRRVQTGGVLSDYDGFNAIDRTNLKLRVNTPEDHSLDGVFLTRQQLKEAEKDGKVLPVLDDIDVTLDSIEPVAFVIAEPIWAADFELKDKKAQDDVTFTVRERLYRYLLREYPNPVQVRYNVSPDDESLNGYRILTLQTYITHVESGNGVLRYLVGYGVGATELQLEGQFVENAGTSQETVVAEFAARNGHGGYPNGYANFKVIKTDYVLKYTAEEVVHDLTQELRGHLPGVRPRASTDSEVALFVLSPLPSESHVAE